MAKWWEKYVGKVSNAGIFYPEEGWIKLKSEGGENLMTYRFHHDNPKGLVFIFHGLLGYSNDSSHVAKSFYEAGYTVAAFDQEGHGKSGGIKGMVHNIMNYLKDSEKYIRKARKWYPKGTPVFLLGMSMGGMMSTMIALNQPENINGIVLLAPALGLQPDFESGLVKVVKCLDFCCGFWFIKELDMTLATRCLDYIQYFDEVPEKPTKKYSVRTFASMIRGFEYLEPKLLNISVPVVIVQGTDDKLVSPELNKRIAENCISADKSYWVYEGMYHDVYHEPEIFEIIERSVDWVNSRLPKKY